MLFFIMKSVFGLYGIVFSSAVTFIFSLSVSTFLCLKWNKSISHTPTASSSEPALKTFIRLNILMKPYFLFTISSESRHRMFTEFR